MHPTNGGPFFSEEDKKEMWKMFESAPHEAKEMHHDESNYHFDLDSEYN